MKRLGTLVLQRDKALQKWARYRAIDLTPRERDVLAMLLQGARRTDIALALQMRPDTVKGHVRSLRSKLHAHDGVAVEPKPEPDAHRTQAAELALYSEIDLTPRERDVLALLLQGASRADIALALQIRPDTAKGHIGNLRRKLRAEGASDACW